MGSWCHGHPHALSLRILCPVRHPLVSLRLWALGPARVLVVGWPHSSRSVRCRRLFTSVEVLGQPSPGRFPGVLSYGAGRLLLYLEVDVTSGHGGPRSAPASSLTVSPHYSVHPVSRPVLFSRSGVLDVFPRVCPATERKREGEKEREKEREEERKCLGAKTAQAVHHGGASGTAAPGGARRLDLGRQRKPPTIWSWRGWSGCAQPKQRGAAFTTSTEFGAGLSWRGAKGWSSSTFPSARLRARTREGAAAKRLRHGARCVAWWLRLFGNLAAWRKGRTSLHTPPRSVHTVASISLPEHGPWDPRWDFPSQEALAHALHNAVTSENWTDQVRRAMLFITCHTQQAINAAAAESAQCWRQWAKEAYQGSAGAAHGFSKVGLDDDEVGGLAGPELLVKQLGAWLPLWLDGRRAIAKQLADQEDWGELLPRP